MASGSWNDSGDTPAQHNMYTKWKFGWSTPTVISSTDTLSLRNTSDYNEAFRIDTTTPNSKSWDNANTNKPVTNISEATGVITFDFMGGANQPPAAPSNLKAKAFKTTVDLTWTDNASNEDGVRIYRGDSPFTLQLIDTIGVDSTSYPDSGLTRKTVYYYKVYAYNSYGEGCSETIQTKTK